MTTLREQLARKRAHSTHITFPLGEDGERAKAKLEEAERDRALAVALGRKDDGAIRQAERRVKAAQKAYEQVSLTIRFRGLTEEERDALMSAHPATDEQITKWQQNGGKEEEKPHFDLRTFLPAALAVCALDSDLSEEEWAAELASDRWTAGEQSALASAVLHATYDAPAPGLGKG